VVINRLLPRAGLKWRLLADGRAIGRRPDDPTRLPAEAVTTRHGVPAMPCRQVFGLADPGLATHLLAFASRPLRASA